MNIYQQALSDIGDLAVSALGMPETYERTLRTIIRRTREFSAAESHGEFSEAAQAAFKAVGEIQ